MAQQPIDYTALAKQAGAISSTPASKKIDYAALAASLGGTSAPAPDLSTPPVPKAPIPAALQGAAPKRPSGAWQTLNTPIAQMTATGRAENQKLDDLQGGPTSMADLKWRDEHPIQDVGRQYLAGVEQRASDMGTPIGVAMAALSGGAGNLVSKIPLMSKVIPAAKVAVSSLFGAQGVGQLYHAATHPEMDPDARMREAMAGGAGLAGGAAGLANSPFSKAAGGMVERAGNAMQDAGVGVINRTVGAVAKDFKRGANPGQGYFQGKLGPSWSMDSIANKAAAAKNSTGEQLGSLYDTASQNGVTIPAQDVAAAIRQPIQNARAVITGPGGSGDVEPIDNFASSFQPSLMRGASQGGFTPSEVFGIKRNVSKNTSWSDPAKVGLKDVQQQTAGALTGVLSQQVPESVPLNSQYQNLSTLGDRALSRAQTGSSPLTKIIAKASLGAGGALAGSAVSPTAGLASGLTAMALDSVPVKTTFASGLYHGGRGAVAIGKGLQSLYSPPVEPAGASFAFDRKPLQLSKDVPGNADYGQAPFQGGYASRPPMTGQAPADLYKLPAQGSSGETQPMLGNYIKSGGEAYGPAARMRVVPNRPVGRTLAPETQGLQLNGGAPPLQLPSSASPGEAQPMVMQKAPSYPPLATEFSRDRAVPNRFASPQARPTGGMTVDLYGNLVPNNNPIKALPAPSTLKPAGKITKK